MLKLVAILIPIMLTLVGCSTKDNERYFNAVQQQNETYMSSYNTVENESVQFDGKFEGKISIVKPKKLPQFQKIQRPKTNSEQALDYARVVVPVLGTAIGMHYNFKSADSANKYNAENIKSWTGNFQNTTDTSVTDTSVTDTSVTDTSVTDTSVTDTSVTDTSVTDTSDTQTVPTVSSDGTTATVN